MSLHIFAHFLHIVELEIGCTAVQTMQRMRGTSIQKMTIFCIKFRYSVLAADGRNNPFGSYESVGRGFESLPSHQTKKIRTFFQSEKGSDFSFSWSQRQGRLQCPPSGAPQAPPPNHSPAAWMHRRPGCGAFFCRDGLGRATVLPCNPAAKPLR